MSIILKDVYDENLKEHIDFLYVLMVERSQTPEVNISHKEVPTFPNHKKFVLAKPYKEWYIIYNKWGNVEMGPIGSAYLTNANEIGIFIKNEYQGKGFGKTAICMLMNKKTGTVYYANINPQNARSIQVFEDLGFQLIQLTYAKKNRD